MIEVPESTGNSGAPRRETALIVGGKLRDRASLCGDFRRAGAAVMLADIDERKGREVTDAIVAQGGTAAFTRVQRCR